MRTRAEPSHRAASDRGLTLIEMLAAMAILALIAGAAYSSFTYAANAYRRDAVQLRLVQRTRNALETIATDLNQAFLVDGNQNLQLYVEDVPGAAEGEALDLISFVTVIPPARSSLLSEPLSGEPPSVRLLAGTAGTRASSAQEEEEGEPIGEVWRVLYLVAPSPETLQAAATLADQETLPLSLIRARTTTLSLEESFGELLGSDPVEIVQALWQTGIPLDVLADHVRSFQIVYYDGEEWVDGWDVESQGTPLAFRIALTVEDPDRGEVLYTRSIAARPEVSSLPQTGSGGWRPAARRTGRRYSPSGGRTGRWTSRRRAMRDRGLSLVTTLWIMAVLSILATEYLYTVYLDRQMSVGLVERVQYEYVARAGIAHWIRQLSEDDTALDTLDEAWAQVLEGTLQDPRSATRVYLYSVQAEDEGARINVNRADETMLQRVLEAAGAPAEQIPTLVQNIIAARNEAPFLSIGDLLRVEGMTPELLYGASQAEGVQLQPLLAQEQEQAVPLINLLTVYSVDKNVQRDGSERVNIATADANTLQQNLTDENGNPLLSQGEAEAIVAYREENAFDTVGELMEVPAVTQEVLDGARDQLSTEDEEDRVNINTADVGTLANVNGFDQGIAEDIVRHRNENGNFNSVDDLLNVRVFSRDEIKQVIDKATITDEEVIVGLVNLNTADAQVLALLPGMDQNTANAIVQYRNGGSGGGASGVSSSQQAQGQQTGNPFETVGELLDVSGISDETFQQLTAWVTYRAQVFRIVSEGQTESGETRISVTAVLDRSGERVETKFWLRDGEE
ncbi:MAG: hypothetical protein KatS3mg115_1530 [Candidatus Poribacteria bacterium]|nr:MAG: hypothetical protein KatS3mg115_1530 [Candidatus Poribacteria bacterium]